MLEIIPKWGELERYAKLAQERQLGFEYNDFFMPSLLDDKTALAERVKRYQSLMRPGGIDTLHGVFFDMIPFSLDEGIRNHSVARMQQSMEIAEQLQCRGVVFHTNINPQFLNQDWYFKNWLELTAKAVETLLSTSRDTRIYMENMFDDSPEPLRALMELFGKEERVGVCLDVGHMMLMRREPEEWFVQLAPYIMHLHINDNHLVYDEHLAVGDGKIPWEFISALLKKYGLLDKSILLEVKELTAITQSLTFLGKISIFNDEVRQISTHTY